ncbi:hypothetical protein BCR36DRAFT_411026 [Piromyces finnis]|uniref:NAD(+) diphosphatase n=1 Tax=Piromyces finnis TaxID=1754191 RepID=A0A1Y1VG01_9FUNG|nr:hypothetical protein BCR36DRAFT_411026 [Piromyces finnis]|eukprot:ORX53881.1 hypothetical protein BCR36DRAFT_411026 [Piromyces finnis]
MVFKFPKPKPNFFSENFLNRHSAKRGDEQYIKNLKENPTTRYILYKDLNPLLKVLEKSNVVAFFNWSQVQHLFSEENIPIFLGLDEKTNISYFACNVTKNINEHDATLEKIISENKYEFLPMRPHTFALPPTDAAIVAQGRAMVDWNMRNVHCPACGKKNKIVDSGHKHVCPDPDCYSNNHLNNYQYPRTDPVIIVLIISKDGKKVLLGRHKNWTKDMYSCIAGFIEPAESLEMAVKREALEETGVIVDDVNFHSSQPWPFPNSLMFACYATAQQNTGEVEDLELEDYRWFTRQEVLDAIAESDGKDPRTSNIDESIPCNLRLPQADAVAYRLISGWALATKENL